MRWWKTSSNDLSDQLINIMKDLDSDKTSLIFIAAENKSQGEIIVINYSDGL